MINEKLREVQFFFRSQAFLDGLKATVIILLPGTLGALIDRVETGLTLSLGAFCVSITDLPGPLVLKRKGMLFTLAFLFLTSFITGLINADPWALGITIAAFTFGFSMFTVYGNRASAVGSACILVLVLTMDERLTPLGALLQAFYILLGGLFYTMVSLATYVFFPYRQAQRTLGQCIREVAQYLEMRSRFYNPESNLDATYRQLIDGQVSVNEKLEAVREVFFKTKSIVEEKNDEAKRLVYAFSETVDLFEEITTVYTDYATLREEYRDTGALQFIRTSLLRVVHELKGVGFAIQTHTRFSPTFDYDEEIIKLKSALDIIGKRTGSNAIILSRIVVNIRKMLSRSRNLMSYFDSHRKRTRSPLDHSRFISNQSLHPQIARDNLTLGSSVFRHSIRVSLACTAGYALSQVLAYGDYSYWILLTIAFILKPAFSLTKKRNYERLAGTLAGGAVGAIVLLLISNTTALFIIMVFFMLGTYSFLRTNYLAMVFFTTPYVLILFSLMGEGFRDLAEERILDTVIGCIIAFAASYFLFPQWERDQVRSYMAQIINANAEYLAKAFLEMSGQKVPELDYKLVRKNVYLHSANLSASFSRMLSEPKSKQVNEKDLLNFTLTNHLLFSHTASLISAVKSSKDLLAGAALQSLAKRAYDRLQYCEFLLADAELPKLPTATDALNLNKEEESDLRTQLQHIVSLCEDLKNLTDRMFGEDKSAPAHSLSTQGQ